MFNINSKNIFWRKSITTILIVTFTLTSMPCIEEAQALSPWAGMQRVAVNLSILERAYLKGKAEFTSPDDPALEGSIVALKSEGKILLSNELAGEDAVVKHRRLTAVFNAEIKAALDITANRDVLKYQAIVDKLFSDKKILSSYAHLFPESSRPDFAESLHEGTHREMLANDMIARAFEVLLLEKSNAINRLRLTDEERYFIENIEGFIQENKNYFFTGIFWNQYVRETNIRVAIATGQEVNNLSRINFEEAKKPSSSYDKEKFYSYAQESGLTVYPGLRKIFTPRIINALLDDSALKPVFLQVMPSEHLGPLDISGPDIVAGENLRTLLENCSVFNVGSAEIAERLAKEGKNIVVGVVDRKGDDLLDSVTGVANGRQAYIPLQDGTWLGIKGAGQFNFEMDPPFFLGTQLASGGRYEGLAWIQEAEAAKKNTPILRASGARVIEYLGHRRIYAAPDGEGGFTTTNGLIDKRYDHTETVLIFNRVMTPHRISKLPHLLEIDPGLKITSEKISNVLISAGYAPEGTKLRPDELILLMVSEWGKLEAKKQNLSIFKKTSHSQDLTFAGEEADMEEMCDSLEYRTHLTRIGTMYKIDKLLELFDNYGLDVYGMQAKLSALHSMERYVREHRPESEYDSLFPDTIKTLETLFKSYFSSLDAQWLSAWGELNPDHASRFNITYPLALSATVSGTHLESFHMLFQKANKNGTLPSITPENARNDVIVMIVLWAKEEAAKREKREVTRKKIPGETDETVFFEISPDDSPELNQQLPISKYFADLNHSYLSDISAELVDRTDPYHSTKQRELPVKILLISPGRGNTSFDFLYQYKNKINLTVLEKEDLAYKTPEELMEHSVPRLDKDEAYKYLNRLRSQYVQCDLDAGIQLADGSYDVVIVDESALGYVRDKAFAMREMIRVCSEGGVIYCSPKGGHILVDEETLTFGEYFARQLDVNIDSLEMTDFDPVPREKRTSNWIKISKTPGLNFPELELLRSESKKLRPVNDIPERTFWTTYYKSREEPLDQEEAALSQVTPTKWLLPEKTIRKLIGTAQDIFEKFFLGKIFEEPEMVGAKALALKSYIERLIKSNGFEGNEKVISDSIEATKAFDSAMRYRDLIRERDQNSEVVSEEGQIVPFRSEDKKMDYASTLGDLKAFAPRQKAFLDFLGFDVEHSEINKVGDGFGTIKIKVTDKNLPYLKKLLFFSKKTFEIILLVDLEAGTPLAIYHDETTSLNPHLVLLHDKSIKSRTERDSPIQRLAFYFDKYRSNPYQIYLTFDERDGIDVFPSVYMQSDFFWRYFGALKRIAKDISMPRKNSPEDERRVLIIGSGTGKDISEIWDIEGIDEIVATEIDPISLANTKFNAQKLLANNHHNTKVSVYSQGSLEGLGEFDLISFACPLAVTESIKWGIPEYLYQNIFSGMGYNVTFDPDGKITKQIIEEASRHLKPGGRFLLLNHTSPEIYKWMEDNGFTFEVEELALSAAKVPIVLYRATKNAPEKEKANTSRKSGFSWTKMLIVTALLSSFIVGVYSLGKYAANKGLERAQYLEKHLSGIDMSHPYEFTSEKDMMEWLGTLPRDIEMAMSYYIKEDGSYIVSFTSIGDSLSVKTLPSPRKIHTHPKDMGILEQIPSFADLIGSLDEEENIVVLAEGRVAKISREANAPLTPFAKILKEADDEIASFMKEKGINDNYERNKLLEEVLKRIIFDKISSWDIFDYGAGEINASYYNPNAWGYVIRLFGFDIIEFEHGSYSDLWATDKDTLLKLKEFEKRGDELYEEFHKRSKNIIQEEYEKRFGVGDPFGSSRIDHKGGGAFKLVAALALLGMVASSSKSEKDQEDPASLAIAMTVELIKSGKLDSMTVEEKDAAAQKFGISTWQSFITKVYSEANQRFIASARQGDKDLTQKLLADVRLILSEIGKNRAGFTNTLILSLVGGALLTLAVAIPLLGGSFPSISFETIQEYSIWSFMFASILGTITQSSENDSGKFEDSQAFEALPEEGLSVDKAASLFYHTNEMFSHDLERSKKLASSLCDYNTEKVLVVGTGLFHLPLLLALTGKDVTLVEADYRNIQLYTHVLSCIKSSHNIDVPLKLVHQEFGSLNLDAADIKANSFDLVTLVDLAGGIPRGDPSEWLEDTKTLLKEEGLLVIDETKNGYGKRIMLDALKVTFPTRKLLLDEFYEGNYEEGTSKNRIYGVWNGDNTSKTESEKPEDEPVPEISKTTDPLPPVDLNALRAAFRNSIPILMDTSYNVYASWSLRVPLSSGEVVSNRGIILYADDILNSTAALDLETTIRKISGQGGILDGGKVILYAKEEEATALILEEMVKRASPEIETIIITSKELTKRKNLDGTESDEVKALVNFAKSKGAGNLIGLIKGPTKDPEDLAALSERLRVPVVIVGLDEALYSFAQAIVKAMETNKWNGVMGWLSILPPIRTISEDMRSKYTEYQATLKALVAA